MSSNFEEPWWLETQPGAGPAPATLEGPVAGGFDASVLQGLANEYFSAAGWTVETPVAPSSGVSVAPVSAPPLTTVPSAPAVGPSESRSAAAPASAPGVETETPPITVPSGEEVTGTAVPQLTPSSGPLDIASIRSEFPILSERVHGRRLVWLDSGATSQKPQAVIDRLAYYYAHENSNVHRAAHELAARSTNAYEEARGKAARFINASSSEEIVWVRGATEGINLVAATWGRQFVKEGDEIVLTELEHHANIVPWQMLAAETGARIVVAPVDDTGQIQLDRYEGLLNHRTRIVGITAVSNAIGTVTPVAAMTASAHRQGAVVLVDAAQAVPHARVDVAAIDADFLVYSGHKMYGPMGVGVLYGKYDILQGMRAWHGGGNMIADVTFERAIYRPAPARFEAGTGTIADAVGLGAAIDWLERVGIENVARHEHVLMEYALQVLPQVPGLRLIGAPQERAGVISFVLDGYPAEHVGEELDSRGIAVRAGHHCAQPILRRLGVESTVRPSFAVHNDIDDIDALVEALLEIVAA